MTCTGKILAAVFGLALVAATSRGGMFINGRLWAQAAIAYGVAGLCLAGLLREVTRATLPGDYTDDLDSPPPVKEAGPLRRILAARTARRLLRDMPWCCERYWTTTGAQHDHTCYRNFRSIA
ncbi:hypothetical protein ACFYSF_22755 [Streptomyces canus]|uniref:hypothetical protein n=1 Tax=Streptomyces canus TaxID=58343 RepID=UPI0036CFD382